MLKRAAAACILVSAFDLGGCTPHRALPTDATASPSTSARPADSWVVGRVTNRSDGKPISAVSFTLYFQEIEHVPRAPVRGRSNREGKFSLGPVTSGLHCLLVSSFGYHAVTREFTLHRGTSDTLHIVLERQPVKTSVQRCLPNRGSIDMCPLDADSASRGTERTRCSGHA